MTTNNNKGFTLIELIMVIVILGILSAVAVPKFFDLSAQAQLKNKAAVLGNIKAGLNLYAANQIVTSGSRDFPSDLTASGLISILDEVPEGWEMGAAHVGVTDTILYQQGTGDWKYYIYTYTAGPPASFAIADEATR